MSKLRTPLILFGLTILALSPVLFSTGMNYATSRQEATILTLESVEDIVLYKASDIKAIKANGNDYIMTDEPLVKISAKKIKLAGPDVKYISIMKVNSTDLPISLEAYEPNTYIFEYKEAGLYNIFHTDSSGRHFWLRFEILKETGPPVVEPPVVDPPAVPVEFKKLVESLVPKEKVIAANLVVAYEKAVAASSATSVTYEQMIANLTSARIEALRASPPVTQQWNIFFLAIEKELSKVTNKDVYLQYFKVYIEVLKQQTG